MKTIMLVCCAGMSTSLLVTKMNLAAAKAGIEIRIFAAGEIEVKSHLEEINLLLLGPQVRYLLSKMEKMTALKGIPVGVINGMDYGTLNGEAVLNQALKLMESAS